MSYMNYKEPFNIIRENPTKFLYSFKYPIKSYEIDSTVDEIVIYSEDTNEYTTTTTETLYGKSPSSDIYEYVLSFGYGWLDETDWRGDELSVTYILKAWEGRVLGYEDGWIYLDDSIIGSYTLEDPPDEEDLENVTRASNVNGEYKNMLLLINGTSYVITGYDAINKRVSIVGEITTTIGSYIEINTVEDTENSELFYQS